MAAGGKLSLGGYVRELAKVRVVGYQEITGDVYLLTISE
jgi:hypothetical protein